MGADRTLLIRISDLSALVRQTLDLTLAAYPVALVVLQDAAAWRPLEWPEDKYTSWIAGRRRVWAGEASCKNIDLKPICNGAICSDDQIGRMAQRGG